MVPLASSSTRRKRPSADETRERILNSALDVFAQRSFDGAGMREIATNAGVTQPLLNYHFGSKEDLWKAAVDNLFESLNTALAGRLDGLRGVDTLTTGKLMVREFVYFSARNPQLHRIITSECKTDGDRLEWLVDHHIRAAFEQTTRLFEDLTRKGEIANIPPVHLYYILTGAGANMFVLAPECKLIAGVDPSDDHVIETHADAMVELIFRRPPDSSNPD